MNERINELAEQAGITTNLDTDYYEKDMNKWVDYFSEKFAELLLKDVAKFVEDKFDFCGDEILIAEKILEHFGVEE